MPLLSQDNETVEQIKSFNQEIFDEYESRLINLQDLIDLTHIMASILEEHRLYEVILHASQGLFLVSNASLILLTDNEAKTYKNVLCSGLESRICDISFKKGDPIYELFNESDNSEEDFYHRPRLALEISKLLSCEINDGVFGVLKPELFIPLRGRNSFYGFIVFGDKIDGSTFNQDELNLIERFSNIAALSIENARLFDMATLDKMTGTYNRHFYEHHLYNYIERANKYQENLFFIMCDLDHFKDVNDTYGHQIGDFVLKIFARVLKQFTPKDYVIGRFGGEEFVLMVPSTTLDKVLQVLNTVRENFSKLVFKTKSQDFYKTVSIGVSQYIPSENISVEELIQRADEALYTSKYNGRNQITVFKDIKKD